MSPNLCRCGTHMRILAAVRRAAGEQCDPRRRRRPAGGDGDERDPRARCLAAACWVAAARWSSASRLHVCLGAGAAGGRTASSRRACRAACAPRPCSMPGSASTPSGITVFTGKAELGQGIKTALLQVAAEELVGRARAQITLVTADTAKTPNEGYTAGSQSMQDSATAIRHAAAQVRDLLIGAAAAALRCSGRAADGEGRRGHRRRRPQRSAMASSSPPICCTSRRNPNPSSRTRAPTA